MRYLKPVFRLSLWDSLEKIAGSEIARFASAVPVLGYLILFNDRFVDSISFDFIACQACESEPNFLFSGIVKLRLAFFGCLFLLVANILFKQFSPKILASSKTDLDFADRVFVNYSSSEICSLELEVLADNWKYRTPLVSEFIKNRSNFRTKGNVPILSEFNSHNFLLEKQGGYIRAIAREWWSGEMHKTPIARAATTVTVYIGYFMLLAASFDVTQAVVMGVFLS